jgi:hypothetical protein
MLGRTAPEPTAELPAPTRGSLQVQIVLDTETAGLLDASQLSLPDISVKVRGGTLANFMADGPTPMC